MAGAEHVEATEVGQLIGAHTYPFLALHFLPLPEGLARNAER